MRYFGAVMGFGLAIWLAVVSLLIVFVSGGLTHVELSSPRVLVALVLAARFDARLDTQKARMLLHRAFFIKQDLLDWANI